MKNDDLWKLVAEDAEDLMGVAYSREINTLRDFGKIFANTRRQFSFLTIYDPTGRPVEYFYHYR